MRTFAKILLSTSIICASISATYAQMEDDLYAPAMTAKERQERKAAIAEQNAARKQAKLDAQREEEIALRAQYAYYEKAHTEQKYEPENILVDNIDDALYRRMDALNFRPSENSELMEIQERYAQQLQRKFNPDLYNIIIINDKMWVEPKYITSIFANTDDASKGMNDYLKKLKQSSSFNSRGSIKKYYSTDYQYWNMGHYGMQYPTSHYMGYPSGGWYPYGMWGASGWGMTWGSNWGYYWGSYWNAPWYSPWYNPWYNNWYNPWYNPWYGPIYGPGYYPGGTVAVRRPNVVYGNTINGNNGIIRNNYPQSARQYRTDNVTYNPGNRNAYDAGFGRGQNSYNPPQRPATNQNTQPTRQSFDTPTTSRPSTPAGGGGSGFGGGFRDTGGGRRR